MLAALLANIRLASYPIQEDRGKRPVVFWMEQQHPEIFEEKKKLARELKEAMTRLRYLPEDHELRLRFEQRASEYRRAKKSRTEAFRRKLDYLEMALDPEATGELMEMAIVLDDEDFFVLFDL